MSLFERDERQMQRRRDTDTQGKRPYEDNSRDWSDPSINQGTPRIASKPPEGRERQGKYSSLLVSERVQH